MHFTRRNFLAGAGAFAAAAVTVPTRSLAQSTPLKTPFRLAVINDEISQDFDHACHIAAVEFGLSWIELRGMWGKNITNLDAHEIAESRRILEKYKLRVTDIASPLFKVDWPGAPLAHEAPKQPSFGADFNFQQQDELLAKCVDLAKSFNTRRIRCFDFSRLKDQRPYRAAINEKLRHAAEVCAKSNLILVLENEMTCNTATGAESAKVLAEIPNKNFMLNWDPGNAAAAGSVPYPNGYDLLPNDRIGHCHCKDAVRKPDGKIGWAPVGSGMIDWVGQLKALVRQNYHYGLSLETHWRGAGTPEESTRQSMAGLKRVLKQAGALD
ncbi:MAG TPA: sugar phosphate isomerase/epimerase family protein [Acidobacteriaceae bacterium]|nr:sugar phosphate isomerase/epimerase family protein [Acidobacteriaceae bacterium]